MPENFSSYLDNLQNCDLKLLPVNHIANLSFLENFLNSESIGVDYLTDKCEVFDRHLLYIFYGRPAFKLNDNQAYPICFVFKKPESNPIKVFPFDSGAFHHDRMKEYFDMKELKLDDFDISDSSENITKLIRYFFVNNERYYDEKPDSDINLEQDLPCIKGYLKMIHDTKSSKLDDRKSAIELIYDLPFFLNNGSLELIVLPQIDFNINGSEIIEYDVMKQNLESKYICKVRNYEISTGNPISTSYIEIRNIVKSHIQNIF